jgi:beta-barrel assembly-enhancing protease
LFVSISQGYSKETAQVHLRALYEQLKLANPELAHLNIEIFVSTSDEMNAFAAPGNLIVINQGLIQKADSVEEIMGVLAHEVAHVELPHVLKSLAGGLGTLAGTIFLSTLIGSDGAITIAKATNFLQLKYSREKEIAADKKGFYFLQRANVSPSGMIRFFEKLSHSEKLVPNVLRFASTNPSSEERVQVLSELTTQNSDLT